MRTTVRPLIACLVAAAVALAVGSVPALAGTVWQVTSAHGATHMPPGGTGQYVLQVRNVGDTDSDGSAITIVDTLPAGVTATRGLGIDWSCSGIGTGTVTCHTSDVVAAPLQNSGERGLATPLFITVHVGTGVAPTEDNAATVSGGGGAPASTTDPTVFDAAPAGFGFDRFGADVFDPSGNPLRQAGARPFEARIDFAMNLLLGHDPDDPSAGDLFYTAPDEHVKTFVTRLPVGLIGDPLATPRCPAETLNRPGVDSKITCPANTQVGIATFVVSDGKTLSEPSIVTDVPIYNVVPPPGAVAALGFEIVGFPVQIAASLDPSDHYAVITTVRDQIDLLSLRSAHLVLWGVPADPAHDALRGNPDDPNNGLTAMGMPFTGAPIKPFLTMPSQCDASAGGFQARADSWQHPGAFTPWQSGTAMQMTGCGDPRFRFDPSISVQPESRQAGAPTGLDVDLNVPQKDATVANATDLYAGSGDDRAIATPPVRDVTVRLPAGMAVSPSSADGLAACTPVQIKLGTNDEPTCPDASKIGSASITTPLLEQPLTGSVFLAAQNQNPFGSLLAIYIVAEGSGVVVKLAGRVTPDPATGQLTSTFLDNPQMPFSNLHLHLMGGPRAPLVNPAICGTKTTTATITSWNSSLPAVQSADSFPITSACARGFDPGFVAGTTNPVAGKDSPVVTRITRADGDQELNTVSVTLPKGLLGRIKSVPLCSSAAGNAGTCPAASRIGNVTVAAGPGSDPFFITDGTASITGPYKGAPFGLSLVVHAKAGPLDLGNVVVRAQIQVDRATAQLRIVTDPLPRILAGIPLQLRIAQVTVNRRHFTFNPTNCRPLAASARLTSTAGAVSIKRARFEVTDCSALTFHPQMTFTVGSKGHTARGASIPLTTVIRMTPDQANLAGVAVTLPSTINARLGVVSRACTRAQFDAGRCAAKAGTATAVTPLLKRPLRGNVYFVQTARKGALPDMVIALRGQVAVDLTGKITLPGSTQLATSFDAIPDVPITKFTLHLVSGRNGPIGALADLCSARTQRRRATVVFRAQNGRAIHTTRGLRVLGCRRGRR